MDSEKKCKCSDDIFWLIIILFFFLLIPVGSVLLSVKSQFCNEEDICNPIIIAVSILIILVGLGGLILINKKIIKKCNEYIMKI